MAALTSWVLLLELVIACQVIVKAQYDDEACTDRMRDSCRYNIYHPIATYEEAEVAERDDHCKLVGNGLDCVLWQTSECKPQDANDDDIDAIKKGWTFFGTFCQKFRNWNETPCYTSESMKLCQEFLTPEPTVGKHACRNYQNFQDCAKTAIQRDCQIESRLMLGTYLLEKAGSKAWKCINVPEENSKRLADVPSSRMNKRDLASCAIELLDALGTCLDMLKDNMEKLQDKKGASEDPKASACCLVKTLFNCMVSKVNKDCKPDNDDEIMKQATEAMKKKGIDCDEFDFKHCSGSDSLLATTTLLLAGLLLSLMSSYFAL